MSSLSFLHRYTPAHVEIYPLELRDGRLCNPFRIWYDGTTLPSWAGNLLQPVIDRLVAMPFKSVIAHTLLTKNRIQMFNDFGFSFNSTEYLEYSVMSSHVLYVQHEKGMDVIHGIPGSRRILTPNQFFRYLKHISKFAQKHYPV